MVVDVLRRLGFFRGSSDPWSGGVEAAPAAGVGLDDPGGGFDFNEVLSRLQLAKTEIDTLKAQVVNEIQGLYERMLEAARRGDRDSLEVYAAEIVLKKRILTAVMAYSKMLAIAIARIQDARSLEQVTRIVLGIEYAVRGLDEYLSSVSPEMAARLSGILAATERSIAGTVFMADSLPMPRSALDLDPEVEKEIARVMAEVRREVDELVPTRDIERVAASRRQVKSAAASRTGGRREEKPLEERLLDYIKSRRGRIKLSEAARDLGATPEEVREALRRLQEKGLIKVRRRQAQGQ